MKRNYYKLTADSFKELEVVNLKQLWEKVKEKYDGLRDDFIIEKKTIDEKNATVEFVCSTEDRDRHGDIVRQNWDLKNFKKNPIFLNSHIYYDITEILGKFIKMAVVGEEKKRQLEGKVQFAVVENPKAKIAFDLYAGGYANMVSAGFIPNKFSDKGEILESELLEVSGVVLGANQRALAKSAGINVEKFYEKRDNKGGEEQPGPDGEDEEGNGDAPETDGDGSEGDGSAGGEGTEGDGNDEGSEPDNETEKKEVIEKPYPNEHSCRLKSPGKYDRFARKNCYVKHEGKCIDYVFGIKENKSELQSMRYKIKTWTEKSAKSHCKEAKGMFEAATEEEKAINKRNKAIEIIAQGVEFLNSLPRVETRPKAVKVKERKIINRVIRKLVKHKK